MDFFGFLKRNFQANYPRPANKDADALRFGILGAANIAVAAFVLPAASHPEVVVAAIASRTKAKAEAFAQKHSISKTYYGPTAYQQLLDDPDIDAIYNPLPNALHYEWTMKALAAGKHVLLEKPSADTRAETAKMFELADKMGLVLLEAFHYRFHPAIQRVKAIIDSGELGQIKSIKADLSIPSGLIKYDDIRYKYDLGGGGFMDGGGYVVSVSRFLVSTNPTSVVSATPTSIYDPDPRIDNGINAILAFPNNVLADITCDLQLPGWGPFSLIPRAPQLGLTVKCEGGDVDLSLFMIPHVFHSITVTPKEGRNRVEKHYTHSNGGKGEAWWTTYRYQLEAFVDKVGGEDPQAWITPQDSIDNLEWVERVYEKSGLGLRPASEFIQAA